MTTTTRSTGSKPKSAAKSRSKSPAKSPAQRVTATKRPTPAARRTTPKLFWVLVGIVGALCAVGLVTVFSSTTVVGEEEFGSAGHYFIRQACFLVAGLGAMLAAIKIGHRWFLRHAWLWLSLCAVLLVAVLVVGDRVNGARRWFGLGIINVQPSEIAKVAVVLWVAQLLASRLRVIDDWRQTYAPIGLVLAPVLILIYLEPDLGTAMLIGAVVTVMLVTSGARLWPIVAGSCVVVPLLRILMFSSYRANRHDYANPFQNVESTNWQLNNALSSIANGRLFGVGPGRSAAKWGYLPEAHTDAIFAVVAEELGMFGGMITILLYLALFLCGLLVARAARDHASRMLAVGISSLLAMQGLINIGVVLGTLPNKGFTLPFVSYGGSSLIVALFSVGLLLSVAQQRPAPRSRSMNRPVTLSSWRAATHRPGVSRARASKRVA